MADFSQCIPGTTARILKSKVARVQGKSGMIVEASRSKRKPDDPMVELVTIDIPGHGEITVGPADLDVQS